MLVFLGGLTAGMYFLFLNVFGLNVLERDSIENLDFGIPIGNIDPKLILIATFVGLYLFQSITMNLIPGTTTFFISVLAYSLFGSNIFELFLISAGSVLLSSVILYFIGRFAGRKALYWMFGEKVLDTKLDWFAKNGTKSVPWLFLVPLFPTDLLCLACGASKMKFWHFMLIVLVFRPIEVALLLSYPFILRSDYVQSMPIWGRVLAVNMIIVNVVLLVLYYRVIVRISREK